MADLKLTLSILEGDFAVCRLSPHSGIPAWAVNDTFFSITRTPEELSIICPGDRVPEGERREAGWRCLKVEGPLDFSMVGAMAALAAPLGDAGISLLAVATFDTDYLLVREKDFERAITELSGAGHTVRA
ncbi:MAG: ACT domain-containing protein [Blastocatellia bacterium]